jgi:hypothetical protein
MNKKKRILIIGHAQHGKDTTAEILQLLYDYDFESSSVAAARIFLYEKLKDKYGYGNFMECFNDRVNRRAEWHDEICEYNRLNKARLAQEILETSDMYVGMRSNEEIEACLRQGIFDLVIGVYDPRKPEEPRDSFNINLWEKADIVIPNASGIRELAVKLKKLKPLFQYDTRITEASVRA